MEAEQASRQGWCKESWGAMLASLLAPVKEVAAPCTLQPRGARPPPSQSAVADPSRSQLGVAIDGWGRRRHSQGGGSCNTLGVKHCISISNHEH
jgi:hypothetical protein